MYKKYYFIHIENGSQAQALYHGLVLKKVHRVINFKQKPCLKPYIDMNTELRENAKKGFFLKLVNNAVSGKTMENFKKLQRYQACNNQGRRNYFVSETYKKNIFRKTIANKNKKPKILIFKSTYLGFFNT